MIPGSEIAHMIERDEMQERIDAIDAFLDDFDVADLGPRAGRGDG